jgi:hypothetical protein
MSLSATLRRADCDLMNMLQLGHNRNVYLWCKPAPYSCPLLHNFIFSPLACLNLVQKSPFPLTMESQNICIWTYKMLKSEWYLRLKPSSPVYEVMIRTSSLWLGWDEMKSCPSRLTKYSVLVGSYQSDPLLCPPILGHSTVH